MKSFFYEQFRQRFSIRKLTIGVVSASLGMVLLASVPPLERVSADQVNHKIDNRVAIDYVYLRYEDLSDQQKKALVLTNQDFKDEVAESDARYTFIYQDDQVLSVLPNTGDINPNLLALAGGLGIIAVLVIPKKYRHKTMVTVIIVTGVGISKASALETWVGDLLREHFTLLVGESLPQPRQFNDGYLFKYYLKEKKTPNKPTLEYEQSAPSQQLQVQDYPTEMALTNQNINNPSHSHQNTSVPSESSPFVIETWTEELYPIEVSPSVTETWEEVHAPIPVEVSREESWTDANYSPEVSPKVTESWTDENYPSAPTPEIISSWEASTAPDVIEISQEESWSDANHSPEVIEVSREESWTDANYPPEVSPKVTESWTDENYPSAPTPEIISIWEPSTAPDVIEVAREESWSDANYPPEVSPKVTESWTDENYPSAPTPEIISIWEPSTAPDVIEVSREESWTDANYPPEVSPKVTETWTDENYPSAPTPEIISIWEPSTAPDVIEVAREESWSDANYPPEVSLKVTETWTDENYPSAPTPEIISIWEPSTAPDVIEVAREESWSDANYPPEVSPKVTETWTDENYPSAPTPEIISIWEPSTAPDVIEVSREESWTDANYPPEIAPDVVESWSDANYPPEVSPDVIETWSEELYPQTMAEQNEPKAIKQVLPLNKTIAAIDSVDTSLLTNLSSVTWQDGIQPDTSVAGEDFTGTVLITYEDLSTDTLIVSYDVLREKTIPELRLKQFDPNAYEDKITLTYTLADPDQTFVSATAVVYKDGLAVKSASISKASEFTIDIGGLDSYVDYIVKTELQYDLEDDKGQQTKVVSETSFTLERKHVAFKHIAEAELYHKSNNRYQRLYTLDQVDDQLDNYYVKLRSDRQKDIYLAVSKIVPVNDSTIDERPLYKVVTTAPELRQFDKSSQLEQPNYHFYIRQTLPSQGTKYRRFADLIDAIQKDPSGTFEIDEDLRATDYTLANGASSYAGNFSGTLLGHHYAISGLKAPLFDTLSGDFQIRDLTLKDVVISNKSAEWGALAKRAQGKRNSSLISQVSVQGQLSADRSIGGLIYRASNTQFENVSFDGSLKTVNGWNFNYSGGIVGYLEGASSIDGARVKIDHSSQGNDNGANFTRIGGVSGNTEINGSISNVYVTGYMTKTNAASSSIGGIVGTISNTTRISDSVSDLVLKDVNPIVGRQLSSNASVDKATVSIVGLEDTFATTKTAQELAQQIADMPWPEKLGQPSNSNYAVYEVDYRRVKNYKSANQVAYHNMEKLLPFYNKELIVTNGNKATGKLAEQKLLSVIPMAGDTVVANHLQQKEAINKLLLHYADHTIDYMNLAYQGIFKETGIAEYQIVGTELIYTPEQFLTNTDAIVKDSVALLRELDYYGPEIQAFYGLTGANVRESMDKLYLKESFSNLKEHLEPVVSGLISTSNAYAGSTGDVASYIKANRVPLMLGLAYMNRWYNIDFNQTNIKDIAIYYQDFFGNQVDTIEFLTALGQQYDRLRLAKNLTTFTDILGKQSGQRDFVDYLDANRQLFTKWDADTWFRQTTKALLIEKQSQQVPDSSYKVYDKITSIEGEKNGLLPLLTAKEGIIILSNMSGLTYGMYDRYINPELKTSNPQEYAQKLEELKVQANQAGIWQRDHLDFWYRILPEEHAQKLSATHVTTWDGYMVNRQWKPMFGDGANQAILDFFGPIERGRIANNGSGAYADGRSIYFVWSRVLDAYGTSVWTHETVHNLDGRIYLLNNGRREGMHAEAFPTGLLQAPAHGAASDYFVINSVYDFSEQKDSDTRYQNLSPERFKDAKDLKDYIHGMMDVLYVLDYAEARAVLDKPQVIQKRWYKTIENKITNTKSSKTDTQNTAPYYAENVIRDFTEEEWAQMSLKTVNDLIDYNVVSSRGHGNATYKRNGYYWMDMFNSIYAMLPMETGAPSTFMFTRFAYELLADKGYQDGFVPYTSNQYVAEALAANESIYSDYHRRIVGVVNDKRVLKNVYQDQYDTWQDFKKAMFDERIKQLGQLRPVTLRIDGVDKEITGFDALQLLIAQAVHEDIARNTINNSQQSSVRRLKKAIYNAYLRQTNDFRSSIFDASGDEI
ncbi:ZmpA/ZmpB/ZmpC family metallo-endopeptidase [Streptococcus pluranimalium]